MVLLKVFKDSLNKSFWNGLITGLKTKVRKIFYSGGVSMNVKVNKEISQIKNIKFLRVNGSGSDESLSIGVATLIAS